MRTMSNGVWSGVLATSAMTILMLALEKPSREALPPAKLTEDLTPDALEPRSGAQRADLTMVSHFGFGIAAATLYALLNKRNKGTHNTQSLAKGSGFGLVVWASSYLGWIPAFRLRPSAKNLSLSRNLMMIGAHLVWGAVLGFSEKTLSADGQKLLDAKP